MRLSSTAILFLLMLGMLSACQTTDIETAVGQEPTLRQLSELDVVEDAPAEGDIKVRRHASDKAGRFAIAISPIDGSQRNQAFAIAEQAYARMCGQPSTGSGGANEPGVGRVGGRAPLYSSDRQTYFIYMQCPGGQ